MTQSRLEQALIDDLTIIRQWSQGGRQVPYPEIDSINVVIGDGGVYGTAAIAPGVAVAVRVDFNARITGIFLQEFDGTSGSVALRIEKAQGGAAPTWTTITPAPPPAISGGRFYASEDVSGWVDTTLSRADYLRFVVVSATTIVRVHVGLRIRRLEP